MNAYNVKRYSDWALFCIVSVKARSKMGMLMVAADNIETQRLLSHDHEEVLELLNRTWPETYGDMGCPAFSLEYLNWLYNGPDRNRHLLLGCRVGGRLVGTKGLLFRNIRLAGYKSTAHIGTHLTVDPALAFGERIAIAAEYTKAHTLSEADGGAYGVSGDMTIAFYESDKSLAQAVQQRMKAIGLEAVETTFQHAILNPYRLRAFINETSRIDIRPAEQTDMNAMLDLLGKVEPVGLAVQPSMSTLWYHISAAPGGRAFVAETADGSQGALACYVLEWRKAAQITKVVVVEFALARDAQVLASLLDGAVDYAKECGARGVTLENTSYLPAEWVADVGILATPRTMTAVARGKGELPDLERGFICDVK